MKKKTKLLSLLLVLAMLTALLAGCGTTQDTAGQTSTASDTQTDDTNPDNNADSGQKVLRVAAGASRVNCSLDVCDNSTYNYFALSVMGIGECLFKLDDNLVPQYWLATNLEMVDELTWNLTLRDDVTFHNGNPMTATSVKRCLERTLQDFDLASESIRFSSIETTGDYTLTLTTTTPTPGLMSILCDTMFMIYDYEDGCDFATDSSYTGPFMVGEVVADVSKTLLPFENYWGGASNLDKVIMMAVDDGSAALESGDVDLNLNCSITDLTYFDEADGFTVTSALVPRGEQIWFNEHKEVVSDIAVRTAIAKCFDRETIADAVYHGYAVASYGIYPDFLSFGGTENLDLTVDSYDPEGAAKLLADAGYTDSDGDGILDKDGVTLSIQMVCYTDDSLLAVADMLSSELSKLGIELNVTSTYDYISYEAEDNFDIMMITYGMAMIGNPYYWMSTMVDSEANANSGHYANAEVDALIDQMNAAFEPDQRDALCFEIQQHMLDDCHWVVFAHKDIFYVYSDHVTNFKASPCQYYVLDNQIDLT